MRAPRGLSFGIMALLAGLAALGPLATHTFVPALPAVQAYFRADPAVVQLTLSLAMAAMAVATLVYGPLSDRFGRKAVMAGGLVLMLAGSIACAAASSIGVLIAGRVLQAAGASVGLVLGRAVARDLLEADALGEAMARILQAMVLASLLAPVGGALVVELASWRMVFGVVIVLAAAALALVVLGMPETRRGGKEARVGLGAYLAAFHDRRFWALAMQSSFTMASFYVFVAAAPFVTVQVLGLSATHYGLWFLCLSSGFIVGTWVGGRLTARLRMERMVLLGCAVSLVGAAVSLLMAVAGEWTTLGLFGPLVLLTFGNGLSMPSSQAATLAGHPQVAGAVSGLLGFLQLASAAGAAQIAGAYQDATPLPMAVLTVAAAAIALAAVAALVVTGTRN